MTDTAQPGSPAAENVALDDAAHAFKTHLGQVPAEAPRDDRGRFAAAEQDQPEGEEIETAEGEAPEAAANDEDDSDTDAAAEEAQPPAVERPASWSKEDAALWEALPAEAQAKIAEREAQRDTAVNQKFQEAANVRKANEAVVTEANVNRQRYAEGLDTVIGLIQPQKPNPAHYWTEQGVFDQAGYAHAAYQYEQTSETLHTLVQQRQRIAAQHAQDQQAAQAHAMTQIEQAARPAFFADVPELRDPAKMAGTLQSITSYAVQHGIPEQLFTDPQHASAVTSAELHMVWKAMKYDEQRAARTRVDTSPRPAPKPAAMSPGPAVRPGVPVARGAAAAAQRAGAMDRLAKSGSVEDGAAVFKQMMKGTFR
jgi:hypothetical protein